MNLVPARQRPKRAWWRAALALVLLAGAAVQVASIVTAWHASPLARNPSGDGELYWSEAERIAAGQWIGDRPFVAAPLYPYVLAAVRAAGGSLPWVYALQAALHLGTAALVAACARSVAGAWLSPVAALVYLLLQDPADAVARPAHSVLQAASVAWLMLESLRWTAPAKPAACVRVGVAQGIATLANPSCLLLCAAVPVALAAQEEAWRARARIACVTMLAALPLVGAATIHNALACGEWIPLAAHGGVTFAHGNQPGADGRYTAVEGISADGARQAHDARAVVRAELGREPSWAEVDDHFFAIGLRFWREEPLEALAATARKTLHFFASKRFGDVHVPELEREAGLALAGGALAPLPAPWIVLPGAVGLVLLARRSQRAWTAALLGVLPLVVVAAFFFSPRYRLPALPPLTVGAVVYAQWAFARDGGSRRLVRALPMALALALGPVRDRLRLDEVAPLRPAFDATLGVAWLRDGDLSRAEERLREAAAAGDAGARGHWAEILRRRGDLAGALGLLEPPPPRSEPFARRTRALLLARCSLAADATTEIASLERDYPDLEFVRAARAEIDVLTALQPPAGLAGPREGAAATLGGPP